MSVFPSGEATGLHFLIFFKRTTADTTTHAGRPERRPVARLAPLSPHDSLSSLL